MADTTTNIILQGVDRTGTAFRSAATNAARLNQILGTHQARMRQTTLGLQDFGKIEQQNTRLTRDFGNSLMMLAARYGTVAYAATKAYQGYRQFGDSSESLRIVQARTRATAADIEDLHDVIKRTAMTYGVSNDEVQKTFETLRESGYMTLKQAKEIGPAVVGMARQYGLSAQELAQGYGSLMNALKIAPGSDAAMRSLRAMASGVSDLNLDMDQLNRFAPQIADQLSLMGASGENAFNRLLAIMGQTRERFGSTTRTARMTQQAMNEIISGGGLAQVMGFRDAADWSTFMDRQIAQGKDFFDVYTENLQKAVNKGVPWGRIFGNAEQRRFWQNYLENLDKVKNKQAALEKAAKDTMTGMSTSIDTASTATNNLITAFGNMLESVGRLGDALGVTSFFKMLGTEANAAATAIERLAKATKEGDIKGMAEGAIGLITPGLIPNIRRLGRDLGITGRQGGGPVKANKPYVIGEGGPEFFVPDSSGMVLPSMPSIDAAKAIRTFLDAYQNFVDFMNATPLPPGAAETRLYSLHRAIQPEFETIIDQMLSWGMPKAGATGSIGAAAGLYGLLRHGAPMSLPDPIHPLKTALRYYGGKSTPEEQAYWANTRMAQMARGERGYRPSGHAYARAAGGPVRVGESYMVGEHGAELYTPTSAGSVTGNRILEDVDRNTDRTTQILMDIRELLREGTEGGGGGGGRAGGARGGGIYPGGGGAGGAPESGGGNAGYSAAGENPEFNARVDKMIADAAKEGIVIKKGGGFRTRAQQAALYAQKPGLAAPPGSSLHELGIANDLIYGPGGAAWAHRNAPRYGLRFPMGNEPWHIQPSEGRNILGQAGPGGVVRGSWFGNYQGQYSWRDQSDSGRTASGGPSGQPGIALYNRGTLGQMFKVTTPDGRVFILPQTDIGPHPRTGRGVDVSAGAAEMMGYGPHNFPTDSGFKVEPYTGSPRAAGPEKTTSGPQMDWETPGAALNFSDQVRKQRAELEKPITIRARLDKTDSQFRRASIRNELNREVRTAARSGYDDIGAA